MAKKTGPATFSAAPSMTGYLYQCRYALLLFWRRVRAGGSVRISIERFDDVAFHKGAAHELIQTKHTPSRATSRTSARTGGRPCASGARASGISTSCFPASFSRW